MKQVLYATLLKLDSYRGITPCITPFFPNSKIRYFQFIRDSTVYCVPGTNSLNKPLWIIASG